MAKRKFIDWDSIEPLYRAGSMSNYEICRQYEADHKNSQVWKRTVAESAIRKRAKDKKWQKNIANEVKKQIREKLVRNQVRSAHQDNEGGSDQELIDHAADAGVNIVLRHRAEILELLEHEKALLEELKDSPQKSYMANYQGEIISQDVGLTVKEKSATLKDLAAIRAQRIALERQAHNLEDYSQKGPQDIFVTMGNGDD